MDNRPDLFYNLPLPSTQASRFLYRYEIMVNGSSLSTERLADHGRDKNKEQTPSIDCRGDGNTTAPLAARGAERKWNAALRSCESWPAYKSPSLLFDQDLVVNFAIYTRVYMVYCMVTEACVPEQLV